MLPDSAAASTADASTCTSDDSVFTDDSTAATAGSTASSTADDFAAAALANTEEDEFISKAYDAYVELCKAKAEKEADDDAHYFSDYEDEAYDDENDLYGIVQEKWEKYCYRESRLYEKMADRERAALKEHIAYYETALEPLDKGEAELEPPLPGYCDVDMPQHIEKRRKYIKEVCARMKRMYEAYFRYFNRQEMRDSESIAVRHQAFNNLYLQAVQMYICQVYFKHARRLAEKCKACHSSDTDAVHVACCMSTEGPTRRIMQIIKELIKDKDSFYGGIILTFRTLVFSLYPMYEKFKEYKDVEKELHQQLKHRDTMLHVIREVEKIVYPYGVKSTPYVFGSTV